MNGMDFLWESKTMPQLTERMMMMKKLRRGLACLAAAALGVTALSPLGVSAAEQPGMYVAQETADSITYAYNRANSDYDYLTLNQNKFYTWDVRDTNYYTVVLEDGTSLSAADMPENVSLLAENLSCGGGYNGNLWDTKLDGMELTYQEIQQTEKIVTVESDTWAAVEKLFRVPGVKMIYRMEGVYTLKPEISYREAGKEHFGLYVDADTELLAEDIMAAVPSVTSVSEKNAITNYTGMGTGETYTKYSYDGAVDWDANIENKPAALLDLVKQFGKVDGVQYALPEVTYIEIYVSSPDDFILYPVEETTAAEDAVVGDLNQDGSLDVTDAVLLCKAAAGAVELSAAQKSSADVNHDGTVDSSDTVKLMQFLVRLVDTL